MARPAGQASGSDRRASGQAASGLAAVGG